MGLYHKGHLGYGGYVGLMLKTFDFSRHLLPEPKQGVEQEELRFDFVKMAKINGARKKKAIIQ